MLRSKNRFYSHFAILELKPGLDGSVQMLIARTRLCQI